MNRQHFMWVAFLTNGTLITEFNPDGGENSYQSLDREKITHFGLQSYKASYVIDLKDGSFHIKELGLTKKINVVIPISKRKQLGIGGFLPNNQKYDFFQYKSAYTDFLGGTSKVSGSGITQFCLGWETTKLIQGLGVKYIKTSLFLDNAESAKPTLKVIINNPGNPKPIDGSPYSVSLH